MAKYTKQKSGLYRTKVLMGYGSDGKPVNKYLSARSIRELDELVMRAKQDQAQGLLLANNAAFGDYAKKWLSVYKANRGVATRSMYEGIIKNHIDLLARVPLKDINRLMIQGQINARADRPRTCEMILLTVKQILKSAIRDGLILRDPCIDIELPRHVKKEKRALTDAEKSALSSAILNAQERLLLLLLYGTGCRPAEIYALTKSDLDFSAGVVNVNKSVQFKNGVPVSEDAPKTDASVRSVIVSEAILRAIRHQLDKIPTERIISSKSGDLMRKDSYERLFRSILRKAGLRDSGITMYTFRHNFCTECYYNGISLKECQRQMGHANYKMILEVYSHLDSKKEQTAAKMSSMAI